MKISLTTGLMFCFVLAAVPVKQLVIYNDGMAMVRESREIVLIQKNDIDFILENIPVELVEESLVLESDDIEILSRTFITPSLNEDALLLHYIDEELDLVKYGEDGAVSYRTRGILKIDPRLGGGRIFEIDGEIAVNPPYRVLFPNLPKELKPHIRCTGKSLVKRPEIELRYLVSGMQWDCDYALTVDGDIAGLEGWFTVRNNTFSDWDPEEMTLVSGSIRMPVPQMVPAPKAMMGRAASFEAADADWSEPYQVTESEDYALFEVEFPEKLTALGRQQFRYVSAENIPITRKYQVSHTLYHRNQTEPVPVAVSFLFDADEIGDYAHPAGEIMVYEETADGVIFIGSDQSGIVPAAEQFEVKTGRTRDITAEFTVTDYERVQRTQRYQLQAEFKNHKDDAVTVEWLEQINGEWEVRDCSEEWEKADAGRLRIMVDLKPGETKNIYLAVRTG